MKGAARAGIFPDLAAARTKSIEMLNATVDIRQKLAGKMRKLIDPSLSPEERKQLDVIAVQRDGLAAAAHERADDRRRRQGARERHARPATAISIGRPRSSTSRSSRSTRSSSPSTTTTGRRAASRRSARGHAGPTCADLRATIDELRTMHDRIREEIADASREATTAGARRPGRARDARRSSTSSCARSRRSRTRAKMRLSSNDRVQAERIGGLMGRATRSRASSTSSTRRSTSRSTCAS